MACKARTRKRQIYYIVLLILLSCIKGQLTLWKTLRRLIPNSSQAAGLFCLNSTYLSFYHASSYLCHCAERNSRPTHGQSSQCLWVHGPIPFDPSLTRASHPACTDQNLGTACSFKNQNYVEEHGSKWLQVEVQLEPLLINSKQPVPRTNMAEARFKFTARSQGRDTGGWFAYRVGIQ